MHVDMACYIGAGSLAHAHPEVDPCSAIQPVQGRFQPTGRGHRLSRHLRRTFLELRATPVRNSHGMSVRLGIAIQEYEVLASSMNDMVVGVIL